MYNGIIIVDKPQGLTSHDVVARIRRLLSERRVGHGGTLDPMATGVLPVFVGRATKASEYLLDARKAYIASFKTGFETDTEDITGKVIECSDLLPNPETVKTAVLSFIGEISQTPPMYSALKVDGKKLYELARQGVTIDRTPRNVTIYNISMVSGNLETGEYSFTVESSKGLYVRTLCKDIGRKLGCLAAMSALRRIKTGPFGIEDAVTLPQIEARLSIGDTGFILPCDCVFGKYPELRLSDTDIKKALSGNPVPITDSKNLGTIYRVYSAASGNFIMLGKQVIRAGRTGIICEKNFTLGEAN